MNCRDDTSKKRAHSLRCREKSGRVDKALEDGEAPGADVVDTRRSSASIADRSSAFCYAESINVFHAVHEKHVIEPHKICNALEVGTSDFAGP